MVYRYVGFMRKNKQTIFLWIQTTKLQLVKLEHIDKYKKARYAHTHTNIGDNYTNY
jgi:hypothetical protein